MIYGERALDALNALGVETHLVVSKAGARTLMEERGLSAAEIGARASVVHPQSDIGASIASGSFRCRGMLVAPCSIRTMSEIATGVTTSLTTRAADVCLKERRPLVLMVRETPFHLGHLRAMTQLAEMGAIIAPPLPAFYAQPETVEQLVDQSIGRALDLLGLDWSATRRWGETVGPKPDDHEETPRGGEGR